MRESSTILVTNTLTVQRKVGIHGICSFPIEYNTTVVVLELVSTTITAVTTSMILATTFAHCWRWRNVTIRVSMLLVSKEQPLIKHYLAQIRTVHFCLRNLGMMGHYPTKNYSNGSTVQSAMVETEEFVSIWIRFKKTSISRLV